MNRLLVIFLTLLVSSVFAHTNEHASLGEQASSIKASGKVFHESVSIIRKMHPEFLRHKRDKTLRQGVRTDEYSLKGCVSCHANKDKTNNQYHSVDKKGQFCSDCHEQVSVSLDCFSCHRTTPKEDSL
ncbi:intracellular sulfur oxidation protein DsrJ [Abyssogena phaseoliformis symbiont OG214]|uniref:sulfur reduction protein DsrJ n=1 Tax=Abyssogena phaseoliformis symbiont TaxID=596095 RepID=UPI0019167E29|nr:sulfur reduction protein DsrJ [Abyssogena phaseoliformis symbiont]MBW5289709.1 Sulfite reduction-associated complex DsrMKJOP multiheme protein DsrJ [Candidatus Ruthia sp. Apha_13_S6]BBB23000.1 intracellular sulfur oxidation protein DsrJ [Abyssogena phaseoliformis symbiont OG214]